MSSQSVADSTTVTSTVAEMTSIADATTTTITSENTTNFIEETTDLRDVLDSSESNGGLIAGIVIGALLCVVVTTLIGIWIYKKRSNRRPSDFRANKITVQKDAKSDDMETEDGPYEDTDMRDNSGLPALEIQPVHLLHSHGFAATNPRAVPPKPPRLFNRYQEADDVTKAEKDDRVNRSADEKKSQAADYDNNVYHYADNGPDLKMDFNISGEYVIGNIADRNNRGYSEKEYANMNTNPGTNEKRSHTDGEENNRQSVESVNKKYMDMNMSPEPPRKLVHVNTDLRLNILGYAESGGEDDLYPPDLETSDYENRESGNITSNSGSDTGSVDDNYYIEMKIGNHGKDEQQPQDSGTEMKAISNSKERSIARSTMVEPNEIIESKLPIPPPRRSKKIRNKEIGTSTTRIPDSNNVTDMSSTGDNDGGYYLNENTPEGDAENNTGIHELNKENDDDDYIYPD